MKQKLVLLFTVVFLSFIFSSQTVHAQELERILDYYSLIKIQKDSSIIVDEQITVQSAGIDIRHGIYRDIPTRYRDAFFFAIKKPITILSVTKNNSAEPYHTKQQGNNTRIYIGDSDTLISSGVYTYHIVYQTPKQIGYFKNYDEIYWNVTGNGWSFPIDHAAATVELPSEINPAQVHVVGYIGLKGSTDTNVAVISPRIGPKAIYAEVDTKVGLKTGEGLTIAVNFPKGVVHEPSQNEKIVSFISDNIRTIGSVLLLLTTASIYYVLWLRVGKDRDVPPVVVAEFEPPAGMTPAQIRFINQMGTFDEQSITADVVHMAIAGYLTIHENKPNFSVKKTDKPYTDLTAEEQILYGWIFTKSTKDSLASSEKILINLQKNPKTINNPFLQKISGPLAAKLEDALSKYSSELDPADTFTFKQANYSRMAYMKSDVQSYFKKVSKNLIVTNTKYLWIGICIVLAFLGFHVYYDLQEQGSNFVPAALFMALFWNGLISVFVINAMMSLYTGIKTKKISFLFRGIFLSLFLIPFIAVGSTAAYAVFEIYGSICLVAIVTILVISYKALKRRTPEARALQNHIDGFKLFLLKAQARYIKAIQNDLPAKFNMYEKFLPFAIALDVEPQWSAQFKDTIEQMQRQGMTASPIWYSGSHWSSGGFGSSSFASALSGSIASASVNPSSSSGSGGGGSSGGGGGGGGGGGW